MLYGVVIRSNESD